MFHHHDGRFRHVDAHFDDGCGDQDRDLAALEFFHSRVAFGRFHLAVYYADAGRRVGRQAQPRRRLRQLPRERSGHLGR